MDPKYCATCGAEVTSKYCGQCGAKYAVKDVSLKSFVGVIIETITNWEQKMVHTLKHLIQMPGRVAKAFILGDRITYFHPIKFVLFWGGVNLLIQNYFKVNLGQIEENVSVNYGKMQLLLANYGAFFYVAVIPFLALASFLVFRKLDRKYIHHTIILTYATGMNLLISIPTLTLEGIWHEFGPVRDVIGGIFPIVYCIYFYHNYFKQSVLKSIFAGIVTAVFMLIGMFVILTIVESFFDLMDFVEYTFF